MALTTARRVTIVLYLSPTPDSYVAALGLQGTWVSVVGLNQWVGIRAVGVGAEFLMLNGVGGARSRAFCKLTSTWQSEIYCLRFLRSFSSEEEVFDVSVSFLLR